MKQQKKDKRRQSTQNLLGIRKITDYCISTAAGDLVFYIIKPTNISVLPAGAISAKIRALQNTLSAQAGVELLAMNSRESFNATCLFYHDRMQEESNPAIKRLLEQDRAFLDEKQVQMTLAREFYLAVRLKNEKPDTAYTLLSTIETKFRDNGFTTRRAGKEDPKPRYVIPAFRISDEALDKDVALMERLGVEVRCGSPAPSVDELKKLGYTHILMATGAWQAGELGIPGNVKGVIGWMKEMKQQVKPCLEGHVVVVGAGNTAMDAARVAKRMGAASSTIVYRRTKKEMPADEHELKLAIDEGVKLVELAAPVEQKDGKLICNQMKLGEPDASGRRSPVATGETFELPCDLVISAIGEKVDAKLMAENGIEMGRKGPAFQTNVENVWSAGDAHRGPATVVEGIADAAAFAEAVIGEAHTYEIPEQAYPAKADAIAKKGILKMASCACCEGGRCLDCNTVCENCVDSCPNRANVVVKLADGRHEIVHVDKMCNECGNCTQFCPYASEPCHDKFTLFQTEKDMNESENKGVLFLGGDKIRVRLEKDEVLDLSQPNELPQDIETLILTLRSKYSYLYTE